MRTVIQTILVVILPAAMALAQDDLSGDWMLSIYESERPNITRLVLKVEGENLTAWVGSRAATGTIKGNQIEFKVGNSPPKGVFEQGELTREATLARRTVTQKDTRIPK